MSWLTDLAEQARSVLPAPMWEYVEAGAREGLTAAEAETAWHDVRFAPRVLRGGGPIDPGASALGRPLRTPVAIAPTSMQRAAHPDGELAMAAGAATAGALHVVSSNAGHRFADIRAAAPHTPWWLQAYLPPDRESFASVLRAAAQAGAQAVVLTVDTPVPGTKYRPLEADWAGVDLTWFRCNFADPGSVRWAGDLTAADLEWLARTSQLPLVVKGVLHPQDAVTCVEAGVAAVWVSNHGGRQLDRSMSTRTALPRVVEAVAGAVPVYVDGGIRSGLDALAALSLGADLVFLGRPTLHALAVGGADGVAETLQRLTAELVEAMLLAGARSVADTRDADLVEPRIGP